MKSKFKFIPVTAALIFSLLILPMIFMAIESPEIGFGLPSFLFLVLSFPWATEYRVRAHRVILKEEHLVVRAFFGLGRAEKYSYEYFDGFVSSQQKTRIGKLEFLFLMKGNRRVVSISQGYHRNFPELKTKLYKKLNHLGEKRYDFNEEFIRLFR